MATKTAAADKAKSYDAGAIDENEIYSGSKPGGKIKVKRSSFTGAKIVVTVVLIMLAGGFIYLALFQNIFDLRTKFIHAVSSLDPNYRILSERVEEYNENQRQLEADRLTLAAEQEKLDKQKSDLADERAALADRESAVKANEIMQAPIYLRGLTEEKVKELKNLGSIYANMDPDTAAGIMTRLYDVSHMAMIVYHMDAASAADIMTALAPDIAAKVTTELLRT